MGGLARQAVFKFLFKYPLVAFERGRLAFASGWPAWLLLVAIVLVCALTALYLARLNPRIPAAGKLAIWIFQSLTLAILLVLLWRPSLVLSTFVPQQNVLAVLIDDSASMAMSEDGSRRIEKVQRVLADDGVLLSQLRDKFQVRTYAFSDSSRRITSVKDLKASGPASNIEGALAEVYSELRHLPLAGVVIVSDGAQNLQASSQAALQEIAARKVPIYTLGVGQESLKRDLQIDEVSLPRTALPGSLISATVSIRQRGYVGETARLEVLEGSKILKTQDVQFGAAEVETVPVSFTPLSKGIREYTVRISGPGNEEITKNNSRSQLVEIQDRSAKVLYIEGEPRWEYKFIRRAMEEDQSLRVVSLLRTSQNKFYRQGIENQQELGEGLPSPKELFKYDGLIIGSVAASFFSAEQQNSIYDYVSRRGAGILFLGGREALGPGNYQTSILADLLPVDLQSRKGSGDLQRAQAKFQLTARGAENFQLAEDPAKNREAWEKLPPLGTYQASGNPKPGAVVLAEAIEKNGNRIPILLSQRFGRGRGFLFATDGSWRWRMELESSNRSHEIFWRQLLHSLISETPPFVSISADKPLYADETRVRLAAQVYDEDFQPVNNAVARATIHSPDGASQEIELQHSVEEDGVFWADTTATPVGVYRVDLSVKMGDKEIGSSSAYFQRADGILEYFSPEQNVSLLSRLAEQTGGKYYPLDRAGALPEQLTYSPAGVSVPEVRDLWDMPFWLILLMALKGTEWLLRKHWKTV